MNQIREGEIPATGTHRSIENMYNKAPMYKDDSKVGQVASKKVNEIVTILFCEKNIRKDACLKMNRLLNLRGMLVWVISKRVMFKMI